MSFVTSDLHAELHQYMFHCVEGGVFNPHSRYGSITRDQCDTFLIAIVKGVDKITPLEAKLNHTKMEWEDQMKTIKELIAKF